MTSFSETEIRLSIFAIVFLLMAAIEWTWPRRTPRSKTPRRWLSNIAIAATGSLLVRLMASLPVPVAAVLAAAFAAEHGVGLFNLIDLPAWLELVIALVVLDFAIYLQHVVSHHWPMLWRLHRVHHADVDFDVTTAVRFHPFEIGLSMLYKVGLVVLLGPSVLAVLVFEILLNALAMFNHANIALPLWLDRWVRRLVVTPDMHRVHHSVYRREHDTNFGFNLSIWDRLFGTYTDQPFDGHARMTIGLADYQDDRPTGFRWSLLLPWRPLGGSSARPDGQDRRPND